MDIHCQRFQYGLKCYVHSAVKWLVLQGSHSMLYEKCHLPQRATWGMCTIYIVHVHGINCTLGKFSQLLQMYMHVSLGIVEIPVICGHETLLMCWALISCNLPTLYAYILISHLYTCLYNLVRCMLSGMTAHTAWADNLTISTTSASGSIIFWLRATLELSSGIGARIY